VYPVKPHRGVWTLVQTWLRDKEVILGVESGSLADTLS
jgi:hypothetical protein